MNPIRQVEALIGALAYLAVVGHIARSAHSYAS
jgi:hypothetical protein